MGAGFLTVGVLSVRAQVSEDGGSTVFRTGTGEVLLSSEVLLRIPPAEFLPELKLELGFSTSEPEAAETFFDSLSLTLQQADSQVTAVLLTLDRSGVLWAPITPGGVEVDLADLDYASLSFPDLDPLYDLSWAFSITYRLPDALAGSDAAVYVDLFDNLNDSASVGYVRDVRIASTGVPEPTFVQLESSASPDGPFAEESGVEMDWVAKTLRLPAEGVRRFFSLESSVRARVVEMRRTSDVELFRYVFDPEILVLETAGSVNGPWVEPPEVQYRSAEEKIEVPLGTGREFFRVRTEAEAEVLAFRREADRFVLHYRVYAPAPRLLSSASLSGPYAVERGAEVDADMREVRLPRGGRARFFRLRSDQNLRVVAIQTLDGEMWIRFE